MIFGMPKRKTLRFDYLTIFPEAVLPYLASSILGRAAKKRLVSFAAHDLRRWTHDKHKTVDDKPFGGGPGMLMKPQPFLEALVSLKLRNTKNGKPAKNAKKARVIATAANGKPFTHADAVRLAERYDRIVFLCGRYEGMDQRILDRLTDEVFSIGPYVLTGGELPALVMTDAIARHVPGVLGKETSLTEESWSDGGTGEYPQYTRPETWLGMKVPKVLLSGDHTAIVAWRKAHRSR